MKDLVKFESELIRKMLDVLIQDLINGIEQSEAGYRTSDAFNILLPEEKKLLRLGILEKNSKGMVRLNFRNTKIRQQLRLFDFQLNQVFWRTRKKLRKLKSFLIELQKYFRNTLKTGNLLLH